MTAPSHDALVAAVAAAAERLVAMLERENAALRARRNADVAAMAADKAVAAKIYEARLTALGEATAAFSDLPDDARRTLRSIGERLARELEQNASLLEVAVAASRKVMQILAEVVRTLSVGVGIYGANGAARRGSRSGAPTAIAVSVDRAL
jgi:hypothetical protein